MNFEDEFLVEEDPFQDVEPDDEEYNSYSGNMAVYFRTPKIALIMPRAYRFKWFLSPDSPQISRNSWGGTTRRGVQYTPDVTSWIDRLYADATSESGDLNARNDLKKICNTVLDCMQEWSSRVSGTETTQPYTDADLARVISCCVGLDLEDLFLKSYKMCPARVPSSTFESIGSAYVRWELDALFPHASKHISSLSQLSSRLEIINAFKAGVVIECRRTGRVDTPYLKWCLQEANNAVSDPAIIATGITVGEDGATLARQCIGKDQEEIFEQILPAMKRNVKCMPVALAFLREIHRIFLEGSTSSDIAQSVYRYVLESMRGSFNFQTLGLIKMEEVIPARAWMPKVAPVAGFDQDRSKEVAELLRTCECISLNSELNLLVTELLNEVRVADVQFIENMALPFLKVLGKELQQQNITQDSPFPQLYQQVFSIYLQRYVKDRPQFPRDWSRPTIDCPNCKDCNEMNYFLANPRLMKAEYTYGAKRREHMISMVEDIVDCRSAKQTSTSVSLTLYLTKSTSYIEKAIKKWDERSETARARFKDIESQVNLKPLLGNYYMTLMSTPYVLGTPDVSHAGSSQNQYPALIISNNAANRAVPPLEPRGTKRKAAEVVVIDD
ncbi:hypothetical protein VTL71DRAFT_7457 [Oculimacula yallundae]|uniref:Uncharacterized protein n=1 Tax=Oculimacula yallundae TaxID=86028 RepID=A0ABR4BU70_9HELO